jgi:hypothetical protein
MIISFLSSCSSRIPALQPTARFRNGHKACNGQKPSTMQAWLYIEGVLASALQCFSTDRHLSRFDRAARPASLAVSARESAYRWFGSRLSSTVPMTGHAQ